LKYKTGRRRNQKTFSTAVHIDGERRPKGISVRQGKKKVSRQSCRISPNLKKKKLRRRGSFCERTKKKKPRKRKRQKKQFIYSPAGPEASGGGGAKGVKAWRKTVSLKLVRFGGVDKSEGKQKRLTETSGGGWQKGLMLAGEARISRVQGGEKKSGPQEKGERENHGLAKLEKNREGMQTTELNHHSLACDGMPGKRKRGGAGALRQLPFWDAKRRGRGDDKAWVGKRDTGEVP